MRGKITTVEDLDAALIDCRETEGLEFKEAKASFSTTRLVEYCAALANQRGGQIIFGVSDKLPRKVVGSAAFDSPESAKKQVFDALQIAVNFAELQHPDGRVLVVTVPSRHPGVPISLNGRYLTRVGESLVAMDSSQLRQIFEEVSVLAGSQAYRANGYRCGLRAKQVREHVRLNASHLVDLIEFPSEGLWLDAEQGKAELSAEHVMRFAELTGADAEWLKHGGDSAPYPPTSVYDISWKDDLEPLKRVPGIDLVMLLAPETMELSILHPRSDYRVDRYHFTFRFDFWDWVDDQGHIPEIWRCLCWLRQKLGVVRSALLPDQVGESLLLGEMHGLQALEMSKHSYWFQDLFDLDRANKHVRASYSQYGPWFAKLQRSIKAWGEP